MVGEATTRVSDLYIMTEAIYKKASSLHLKMENNEVEDLEALPLLFAKRQEAIEVLDLLMKQPGFEWTPEERESAGRLTDLELRLQPLLINLHLAYKVQMERISQTKQMQQKYRNSYQNVQTDGTFFDTRK